MKKLFVAIIIFSSCFVTTKLSAQGSPDNTISTAKGPLTVYPIQHATFAMDWNGKTIYVDPTGGSEAFSSFNDPDLILITHAHGDHLDPETLQALDTENAVIVVPQSVADKLTETYGKERLILANGDNANNAGISIGAVPMYNLPESEDSYHPKGWGNGYVLSMADKKVYISGDTEDITEMRSLKDIDLAFVCMNLPYTMNVEQASDAVLDFKPNIIYPYHYKGQDVQKFKQLVTDKNSEIEVRLGDWY